MVPADGHAARALLHYLQCPHARVFPYLPPQEVGVALTLAGVGLDHHIGEQPLALCHDDDWSDFTLVTDRRIVGGTGSVIYNARYSRIINLDVKVGLLDRRIFAHLTGEPAPQIIANDRFSPQLGPFITELCRLPPNYREPAARPLSFFTEADPCGVGYALGAMPQGHPMCALLESVASSYAGGELTAEVGQDAVGRIALMYCNTALGRGMVSGRWLSPVSRDDLSHAMVHLFGQPRQHSESPVRVLEFATGLATNYVGAGASTAIGLASMAILGVGWVSSVKTRISRMFFQVADTPASASFLVTAPDGRSIHCDEPQLAAQIDGALAPMEQQLLERRMRFGWQLSTMDLLAACDPS